MSGKLLLGGVLGLLLAWPGIGFAHPHILVSQVTRFIEKDGFFVAVETSWRFDPAASEFEIVVADTDKDGKLSAREVKPLGELALNELKSFGYLIWFRIDGKDQRPTLKPSFDARIADPAEFVPEGWAPVPDKDGKLPPQARPDPLQGAVTLKDRKPRRMCNLVYVLRHELPKPVKTLSLSVLDPEDYIRLVVDEKTPVLKGPND